MKYILLDTCTIVDCAYSRGEKAAPSLLGKVLEACERDGVKLLVPEVVLLELDKASAKASSRTFEGLKAVEDAISEISKSGILGGRHLGNLREALKAAKGGIKDDARASLERMRAAAEEAATAERIDISESDVVEAIRVAIAQKRPAKAKAEWGLVQGDCLIIAGLARFMKDHPNDEFVLCSSNVSDFACKSEGSVTLHPDIAERLGSVAYYTNPAEMLKAEQPGIDDVERDEIEELGESFERVSSDAWFDYPGVVGGMQAFQNAMAAQAQEIDYDAAASSMIDTMAKVAGVVDSVAARKAKELVASTGALANIASMNPQVVRDVAANGSLASMVARLAKESPRLFPGTLASIDSDEWAGNGAEEPDEVPGDGADG